MEVVADAFLVTFGAGGAFFIFGVNFAFDKCKIDRFDIPLPVSKANHTEITQTQTRACGCANAKFSIDGGPSVMICLLPDEGGI